MQAPDRTNAVSAVWGWVRMHLAIGLLEHWGRLDDASKVSTHLMLPYCVAFGAPCT